MRLRRETHFGHNSSRGLASHLNSPAIPCQVVKESQSSPGLTTESGPTSPILLCLGVSRYAFCFGRCRAALLLDVVRRYREVIKVVIQ